MDILSKPILKDEIEWRIMATTKGQEPKTIIVPYITNRCVMDRFDAQFGNDWKSEFREVDGGFICRLSVKQNDEWVYREDGASKTSIEPVKGGISDSMKRAAHQFGLGRNLYSYPKIMLKGEHRYIPDNIFVRLDKMVDLINNGALNKEVVVIDPKK